MLTEYYGTPTNKNMTQTKITRRQQIQICIHPSNKLAIVTQAASPLCQNAFVRLPIPDIWYDDVSSQLSIVLVAFEEFLTKAELSNAFDFYNEWFEIPDDVDFEGTIKELAKLCIPEYKHVFYSELLKEKIIKNALFSILDYASTLIQQKHHNKFKYD
jgi:hypothetical protein